MSPRSVKTKKIEFRVTDAELELLREGRKTDLENRGRYRELYERDLSIGPWVRAKALKAARDLVELKSPTLPAKSDSDRRGRSR